jgi:hypothetical protein
VVFDQGEGSDAIGEGMGVTKGRVQQYLKAGKAK